MNNSRNEDNSIKLRYFIFRRDILIRIILSYGFFGVGLFFLSISGFGNLLSLQILLVLSPLVILWALLDTLYIFLLRRRYSPPIFILLYKPHLIENKKRSILKWLFILSILIGQVLAVSFNATFEFNTGFFLLVGMAGIGQSLTLYFSSKFDYEENQIEESDQVL